MKLIHHVTTVIRDVRRETGRVFVYELADPDDWELPPFTPGAHIDVFLGDRTVRQYSLCGSARERRRYKIAVQAEADGRGGSRSIHEKWQVGATVPVSLPRNNFPLVPDARRHIFVAGGIGITPFIPMIDALAETGGDFQLHYASRTPEDTPFRALLSDDRIVDRVFLHHSRTDQPNRLNVATLVNHLSPTDAVYVCGPAGLIKTVASEAHAAGVETVRSEQFTTDDRIVTHGEAAYKVELARTGRTVDVLPGQSMIDALREAGVEIDSSCQAGVCTSCKTRYLSGAPVHKDLVMSPEERREFITPCVSQIIGSHIVLDL